MSTLKLFLLFASVFVFPALAFPQTEPEPSGDTQDVIKFETSLVQTDVTVFDKQGRFVDGVKPEQCQLKINNTPRDISFFERVTSGAAANERPEDSKPDQPNITSTRKSDAQRRTVIFFVDDLHLAPDSLARARKALLEFIENRVRDNDLVAVTSPSGQVRSEER